jgi:hypothetical protein
VKSQKAKAAIARDKERARKLQEEQQVAARFQALKSMTSGFAKTTRSSKVEREFIQAKMPVYRTSGIVNNRSAAERFPVTVMKVQPRLTGEMAEREEAAKDRYREIQNRVGPTYNKGGDMLMSESEYAAMKRGELRRR